MVLVDQVARGESLASKSLSLPLAQNANSTESLFHTVHISTLGGLNQSNPLAMVLSPAWVGRNDSNAARDPR